MSRPLVVFVLVSFPLLTGCGGSKIPAKARNALDNATQFELFSLDPDPDQEPDQESSKDGFHGWRILGKTPISDMDLRKKLVAALQKGAAENDGTIAGCFNPRHGIRTIQDGKTVDFLICFECYQVCVLEGDQQQSRFLVSRSPQPAFDQALRDANVPLAKKAPE